MHKHRRLSTFLLASATVVMSGASAFAQVDAPPAGEAAPVDVPPPPPPPPPPPVEIAPPPPVPPAAVPMAASVAATTAIAPSQSPFKIETPNGSSIKIGLLLQPQFQMLGNNTDNGNSYNLYLRRTRLLVGGTLFGAIDYFFETDYSNLFLAGNHYNAEAMANVYTKDTPGMNIQDAFATAHPFGDVAKLDVGYMLPPLAHNAVQGAGTLYSWDYFANSFNSTAGTLLGSTASPVGRDTGAQLRGLVVDGHLEYRLGLFQGLRHGPNGTDVGSQNFFRAAGRLQINLLDPETGFFYAGTYLGAKKILSIGGSFDIQGTYHYYAGDLFADLPAGPGVFTAQVNFAYWKGGTDIVGLPTEKALMGEIGYNFAGLRISPILRAEKLWNSGTNPGRYSGGVGWWPYGHSSNLKLFYTQARVANEAHAANQVNLQWQIYFF